MVRNLLLWLHLAGVAGWLGCNFALFVLAPQFERRGGEVAASFAEATSMLARRYYNAVGAVVGFSGVLLVGESGYGWGSGFVAVGIVALVVGAVLGVVVFAPSGARLAAAHRGGEAATATQLSRRTVAFLAVDTSVVLLTVLAMVARWRAR